MSDQKPRIAFIGTGGTISFEGRNSLDLSEYMDFGTQITVSEILSHFPEVGQTADMVPFDFKVVESTDLRPNDWRKLAEKVNEVDKNSDAIDGIVITHGTASLEETAYFLHLTVKTDLPVVVIGSQRPSSGFGTDAGSNLLAAVRTAASSEARGLGVVTLLNEEIQCARDVTKGSTLRLEAFRTPDLGMLGYADPDGTIAIYRKPARPHTTATEFELSKITEFSRVDIVASYAGADGVAIDAAVNAGAKAVVIATFAPGLLTPSQREAVERALAQDVVIVFSSRAGSGRVQRRASMRKRGIIAADNLNPQKARVLALLALTQSTDAEDIQRMFDTY
jgi:L-asparaginase